MLIDRFVASKRGQLQVILELVAVLDGAHTELYLMLIRLLLARHEEVVEAVSDIFRLSVVAIVCVVHVVA